mmetsp:Transcript_60453/g.187208  ORF Transcript_60453/g.187208 Transcript_60453/m.187208 type:complete len:343 (+) Transcript_60453:275-1303(+)
MPRIRGRLRRSLGLFQGLLRGVVHADRAVQLGLRADELLGVVCRHLRLLVRGLEGCPGRARGHGLGLRRLLRQLGRLCLLLQGRSGGRVNALRVVRQQLLRRLVELRRLVRGRLRRQRLHLGCLLGERGCLRSTLRSLHHLGGVRELGLLGRRLRASRGQLRGGRLVLSLLGGVVLLGQARGLLLRGRFRRGRLLLELHNGQHHGPRRALGLRRSRGIPLIHKPLHDLGMCGGRPACGLVCGRRLVRGHICGSARLGEVPLRRRLPLGRLLQGSLLRSNLCHVRALGHGLLVGSRNGGGHVLLRRPLHGEHNVLLLAAGLGIRVGEAPAVHGAVAGLADASG